MTTEKSQQRQAAFWRLRELLTEKSDMQARLRRIEAAIEVAEQEVRRLELTD